MPLNIDRVDVHKLSFVVVISLTNIQKRYLNTDIPYLIYNNGDNT